MNLLALVLAINASAAPDALVADDGIFTMRTASSVQYRVALREALLRDRQRSVQMVAILAQGQEYAVYVALRDGQPRLVARRNATNLWQAASRALSDKTEVGKGWSDSDLAKQIARTTVPCEEFTTAIAPELVQQLQRIWRSALAGVRPRESVSGVKDSDAYYFAETSLGGSLSGVAHIPGENALVHLGQRLFELARCSGAQCVALRESVTAETEVLLRRYNGSSGKTDK